MRLPIWCAGIAVASALSAHAQTNHQATSAIIFSNEEGPGWETNYDGVQASATYTFKLSSVVDNEKVIQRRQETFQLLTLECGADGYSMSFTVPHHLSALKAEGMVSIEFEGRRYKFYHAKDLFLANQQTVPKTQFNQLLEDLYQYAYEPASLHLRANRADFEFYLRGPLEPSARSRKAAIGLIRSACR